MRNLGLNGLGKPRNHFLIFRVSDNIIANAPTIVYRHICLYSVFNSSYFSFSLCFLVLLFLDLLLLRSQDLRSMDLRPLQLTALLRQCYHTQKLRLNGITVSSYGQGSKFFLSMFLVGLKFATFWHRVAVSLCLIRHLYWRCGLSRAHLHFGSSLCRHVYIPQGNI